MQCEFAERTENFVNRDLYGCRTVAGDRALMKMARSYAGRDEN